MRMLRTKPPAAHVGRLRRCELRPATLPGGASGFPRPHGRLRHAEAELGRRERTIWACRYPEEVPIVDGEVQWIALRMAGLG